MYTASFLQNCIPLRATNKGVGTICSFSIDRPSIVAGIITSPNGNDYSYQQHFNDGDNPVPFFKCLPILSLQYRDCDLTAFMIQPGTYTVFIDDDFSSNVVPVIILLS